MASTEPSDIAHTVADALGRGAAVGVILNTVSRAQQVYRAISELVSISPDDFILFHAESPILVNCFSIDMPNIPSHIAAKNQFNIMTF